MDEQKQDKPTETKPTRGAATHRSRAWLWVLGTILVILALLVLLVPVILSSARFTRWVQAKISRSTGGQAHIGDLSVGWLRGVRIADFRLRGQNDWTEIDVGRIVAQPSYGRLFSGTLALGRVVLDQPRVAIDLRGRPATENRPLDANQIERLGDVVVRDGSVRLTDTTGKTVHVADLNSDFHIRPRGQTSTFQASMAVPAPAGAGPAGPGPARLQAAGEVTPSAKTGWSLRGTDGNVTIEVNDLNLSSVAPFLELAGVQVQAQGRVSGNIAGAIRDGQIENLNATVVGQNINIAGPALQGDRLQTSRLNVTADLAQSNDVINVSRLNAQTDWAQAEATGTLPKTPGSLNSLLESGKAYNIKGRFGVNLAALLSQMPHTLGVRPGVQITGGEATGSVTTTTQAGRATLLAQAQVTGLAGVTNNRQVRLSGPVQTTLRLSTDKQGPQLETLDVIAPFGRLTAAGDFQQIKYEGQADLARVQADLGPFLNLGPYQLAGQVATQGQAAIGDQTTGLSGSASIQQLVLTATEGNTLMEPRTTADFSVDINTNQQVLAVNTLAARGSFGTVNVKDATIPLAQDSPAFLSLGVAADNVNLTRVQEYEVFFRPAPVRLAIGGTAQTHATVTRKEGTYHIASDATRIQDLSLVSPGKTEFRQPEVTAAFDVYFDPGQKTIDVETLRVDSPQIKIAKAAFRRTAEGKVAHAQGSVEGQVDWAAAGALASAFLPGQLNAAGQRAVRADFASTYPVDQPNGLRAHLTGQATLGFDRADYLGLTFGPTEVDLRAQNGLVKIGPLSTTVNNGRFNFLGEANLAESPITLRTTTPVHLAQGVQINVEMTRRLLQYANPIFAEVVTVAGVANFDVQNMAIPLASGAADRAQLTGTLGISPLTLGASSLLNQILAVAGQSVRGQVMAILPTDLTLQNGVVRYSNMQINVGDNPVNFGGTIGLNGILDMTVILPYTMEGRTVRVGQPQTGQRIAVPLTGTLEKPELNLQKLLQLQLQQGLQQGLQQLFKQFR